MISRILANHRLSNYKVAARIGNFEGVKEIVHARLGVGFLPRFMMRREIREGALDQLKVSGFNPASTLVSLQFKTGKDRQRLGLKLSERLCPP